MNYGVAPLACALLGAVGCFDTSIYVNDPDGSPPPWDAGFTLSTRPCASASGVDLLLVVDTSASMAEEQASFGAQIPNLVRRLVEPPDRDGDGALDWLPITDIQIGVVSADMGTGGFVVPTCTDAERGDDGVLSTTGPVSTECATTYPPFATFVPGGSPTDLAVDVACVARAGTSGCRFEQPLEAALKAVSPSAPTESTGPDYRPPTFFAGTAGHALDANRGFVRDGTLLAILVVTDEDDCSARDVELFTPDSPRFESDLDLRCFAHGGDTLHPVLRYVHGLTALREDRPDLLAFSVIAGVPVELAGNDFDRMLGDPRMEQRVDPEVPNQLVPSCEVVGRGAAFPPRRLVRMAAAMGGGRATVQSVCRADLTPAAEAIAALVGARACSRHVE